MAKADFRFSIAEKTATPWRCDDLVSFAFSQPSSFLFLPSLSSSFICAHLRHLRMAVLAFRVPHSVPACRQAGSTLERKSSFCVREKVALT
jgi:hypothetical protein